MFFFHDNKYMGKSGSVNNGNVYARYYLDRIQFPDKSIGEDGDITFGNNSWIYESKLEDTMIYRWGMNTFHISGLGQEPNDVVLEIADVRLDSRKGTVQLHPQFYHDYYAMING
jgi:hypothetical protein